nr:right-handed parallel beta-helix repeat-containing protein [uncultured Microbacterium sp.]
MALVPIANLKGPIGPRGPQGNPGQNSVPPDDAIAQLVSTEGTSATQTATDARYGATMHAPAYGVIGDGVTDDAPKLQALLNAAATFGASVTLAAGSTLLIGATITVPSGTRFLGNSSLVKKKDTLAPNAFLVSGVSDVLIQGVRVDGQRTLFASSEWQHGFYIVLGAQRVALRDVEVFNCNGDGVYVGHQGGAAKDITLENVHSHGNNRQGMSVSHVSGLTATGCRFRTTSGTNPRAGVDIEPNTGDVVCENIKFVSCTFSGNGHFGFLVAFAYTPTVHQGGIELLGCVIEANGVDSVNFGGGLNLRGARDFTMTGGVIRNNVGPGVFIDWTAISRGITFQGVLIEENTQHGFHARSGFDDLAIIGCTFRNNGTGNPGAYAGCIINPLLVSTNLRFVGNTSEGASQRYGFQTTNAAAVTRVMLVGNTYRDNSLGARALADEATSRLDLDTALAPVVTGSRGGNAAVTSALTALAARGLIVNNTTA